MLGNMPRVTQQESDHKPNQTEPGFQMAEFSHIYTTHYVTSSSSYDGCTPFLKMSYCSQHIQVFPIYR